MIRIAKLTAQGEFRKDGSKNIKSYKVTLAKIPTETIAGFNQDTELEVEYKKDVIILKKKK